MRIRRKVARMSTPSPLRAGAIGRPRVRRLLHAVSWLASALLLGLAAWLLHRYLGAMRWHDVVTALRQLPGAHVAGAITATVISFAMLAAFDVLAARRVAPGAASSRLAAFAGFTAHALSNTLGFHAFTGGTVRYRVYASAGLGAGDIGRIVGLASLGVGFGYAVLGAAGLLMEPAIAAGWGRLAGGVIVALLAGLLWWLARPRTLRLRQWTVPLPGSSGAAWQMLIGGVEMSAAIGAMYLLLPPAITPAFADFVPLYLAALLAGIVSHAPGGLGVFEAILLGAFPAQARADVLAGLLCYRLVYNLLPFSVAAFALGVFETRRRQRRQASRRA
jgi:glycosyltransferase 2 family protein